jgi:hypothetical protein
MAVTDPFLDQDQLQQYLPPEDFDPFEAVKASVDTQTQQYDYSNIEDVYGTLGLGDYSAAFVGGLVDAVAATGEGAASIYGAVSGDHRLAKQVARYRDSMDDFLTGNVPDELKQKFMYKAVNVVGAMPAYFAMAAGTGGTGLAARGATALATRGLSYSALGANAFQQGRDDYISSIGAEGRDLTDDEAREANKIGAMTGIPLMVLERVGATTLVNSLFRGTGGSATAGDIVKRLAKAPLAEAGTEGTQTLLQNFIASEVASYDPDRPINAGVIESMILGGIASGAYSVPAVGLQIQSERLAENIDNGNINAQELVDDLGQKLMGAAIDANAIPATGADESKILHTRGNVQKFVDNVLTPLTTTLSKAGPQYKRAFRDFERQTGVQIGKSKQIIEPFIKKMKDLKKISQEDYDTLQDALANVGIINKDNQEVLDALDSQEAAAEVSTPELKDNDVFEVDPNMPSDTTASETYVINGAKTERKTRGLTPDETQGGIQAQEVTAKINGINQQVKNAKQALAGILPDLKINVYASQKEFQDATGVEGDSASGFYKDGQVYINASLARSNTVAHEVFHAAFLSEAPTSKEAQNASLELINTIARSSKNEQLVQYAKRFSAQYDPTVQNEEALAEMFGVLSANYATLDVSTKTSIKAWVAKIADMLGISGLFSEATTDKDMIDAFNALSSSVANGTVTPEGIRITRGSGTIGISGTDSQKRFQANYFDKFTGLNYSYAKNSSTFQALAKKYITKDKSLLDFDGVPMHLHVPDGAFTGSIKYKGQTLAEGTGGLFFPTEYHNDGVFWASTPNAAKAMADQLNAQLLDEKKDGTIRMALMTSNIDKAFSSIQGTSNAIRIINHVQNVVSPKNKAKVQKILLDGFVTASQRKGITRKPKKDKDGEPILDSKGNEVLEDIIVSLNVGNINKGVTDPTLAVNNIINFINKKVEKKDDEGNVISVLDNRTFLDRKYFVEQAVKEITSKANYSMEAIPADYEFRRELQQALKELTITSSKMRMYSEKYKIKGASEGTHAINRQILDGLAYAINEPMIRDQYKDLATEGKGIANGSAYAVLEIDGPVEAFEMLNKDGSQKHESYRYGIRSVSGNKTTINLLRDRINPMEVYELMGRTRVKGKKDVFKKELKKPKSFLPSSGWSGLNYGVNMIPKKKKEFRGKKYTGLFEGYEKRPEGAVPDSARMAKSSAYNVEFNVGKGEDRQVKSITVNAIDANVAERVAREAIQNDERNVAPVDKSGNPVLPRITKKSVTKGKDLRLQKAPKPESVGFQNEQQLDRDYFKAVESGDETKLRELIEQAAVNNGFSPQIVYHGSRFNDFNYYAPSMDNQKAPYSAGMLFSSESRVSENFGKVREFYIRLKNPLNTDSATGNSTLINLLRKGEDELGKTWDDPKVQDMADSFGFEALWISNNTEYDGVTHRATDAMGGKLGGAEDSTTFGVFDPKNIRLADLITRDDNGEIIPLSQRFSAGTVEGEFQPTERDLFKDRATLDREARERGQDFRFQKRPDETHEQALNRMLEKHNMKNEFQSVRKLLNYLYTSGREAGMDVSYMEQYFPRLVTDLAGLQDSWKGQIYDSEIERELDIYAKKKFNGRDLDPLERQVFLENLARNKILRGRTGSIQPAGTKERTIPIIDPDRRKSYYAPAEQALDTYVSSMISSINQMKLIGTARVENGQRVKAGIIGQMMDADLQRGTLSREAINIIQDAVDARFGMNGQQSGFIRGAKNAGYIATMGNIGSAITQLGDFYFSAVQNGLVNTVQSALTSKELSREDILGVKNLITIEAADGAKALQKSVDFVFKYSGISALDGFAKDTNINAALRDMRKKVRGKPNSREYQKLMKELSGYQGRQSAQTIADLRNNVKSDLVLEAIYNRLSNVAPISISEMPAAYARNPNGRILYSLKSYTIKQFDFIRQESFSKMGSKKTFAEGFTNLLRIATLAMAANGSADVLKAILFNREIDEEDLVWNNILRMFGITKYTTTKARKEGIGTALVNTILPPQIGILNDFTKDIDTSIKNGQFDIDEMRSVKYLPFVGKLYYWREGKGKEVEKRLANLKD